MNARLYFAVSPLMDIIAKQGVKLGTNLVSVGGVKCGDMRSVSLLALMVPFALLSATNEVTDLGTVVVEGSALSRYRPEKVSGGTFTGESPEKLPVVVDTLTEDFIRERNPTDLNDLLRWIPGIETGGTSLLVRQPGLFSIRGMGGTEPAFDGVIPVGRGAGLFMDPYMMERVEIVKGPIASLSGGMGAQQNNNGAGGSINMYLKGAHLDTSERLFQETTSVGRNTWRQRGIIDANEVIVEDKAAIRLPASFDIYSPFYTANGSQEGARPREQYTIAPSFEVKPIETVTFGLKSMFISSDSPSYIGVPVWRGEPGGGYGWNESSCRKNDRSKYMGMMVNPYVDWQVTDDWLLKLGGAFMYSHMEQTTREPYAVYSVDGSGRPTGDFKTYCETGLWPAGEKYMTSGFSESRCFGRSYNLYARSVYTQEQLPFGFSNTLLLQPDFYYRENSLAAFGTPTSRYGVTLQDSVGWGWVTLLAGLRYDYFVESGTDIELTGRSGATTVTHYAEAREFAFSPRGGLTIQPLDWLVFFGNLSQTRTPTLGYVATDGTRPTDPWVATQYEGGFRLRPLEKLWFSASYYHIDQENMPQAETVNNVTTYYFEGRNSSDGVELSLSGDITENWTVMAMYAYNFYVDHNATGKASEFERTPRNTVSFNTSYRLHGLDLIEDIVVGMGYRFRSKSYATMRGSYVNENLYFDPSHVFDVNLSVPFAKFLPSSESDWADKWFLTFAVRNLFDERYFDTSRHYYECFVGEPRTFEIGVRGSF